MGKRRGEDVLAERRWRTADAKLIEVEGVDKVRAACLSLAAADVAALLAAVGGGPVVILEDGTLRGIERVPTYAHLRLTRLYRLTVPGDPQAKFSEKP